MAWRVTVVLVMIGFCTAKLPAEDDVAKELKKLPGTWQLVSLGFAGKEHTDDATKAISMVIKDDLATLNYGSTDKTLRLKIKIDPSKDPKTIDLYAEGEDKPGIIGIYLVADDQLQICYRSGREQRPTDFTSAAGDTRAVMTLKRKAESKK